LDIVPMTEAERKKRSQKSAVIVERLVRDQLRAMGCERFDLGIRRDAGEMTSGKRLSPMSSCTVRTAKNDRAAAFSGR
jgi:hypothetical protein